MGTEGCESGWKDFRVTCMIGVFQRRRKLVRFLRSAIVIIVSDKTFVTDGKNVLVRDELK